MIVTGLWEAEKESRERERGEKRKQPKGHHKAILYTP